MKTISELLATELNLKIITNGKTIEQPLCDPVYIEINDGYKLTLIDDFEIKDWMGKVIDGGWVFQCDNFYQWKHHATDQGWLFYQNAKK